LIDIINNERWEVRRIGSTLNMTRNTWSSLLSLWLVSIQLSTDDVSVPARIKNFEKLLMPSSVDIKDSIHSSFDASFFLAHHHTLNND